MKRSSEAGRRARSTSLGSILAVAFAFGCGETRPVRAPAPEPAPVAPPTRPATVLLVEGLPRFDTRRIQGLLIESATYNYQTLLFTPKEIGVRGSPTVVRSEAGPGLPKLAGFPMDLSRYDAIILGDVDPSDLGGRPAVERLVDYVRAGGGLILVCGSLHTPASYLATPLGGLLPFDRAAGYLQPGATLQLTDEGREHPVTRLVPDPAANAEVWKEIGGLTGFVQVRGVADPSVVLVEALFALDPARATDRKVTEPVLLASRAGRGRIAIFLTDNLHAVRHMVTARNYLARIYERALEWARRTGER
jgi:uncharacterized membrane protein